MKKIAILILLSIFSSIILTGCKGQNTVASESTSIKSLNQIASSDLEENTFRHEKLTKILPDLKNSIDDSLKNLNYLDWEQFEKVSEIREFKNLESAETFKTTTAFYATRTNVIIVCPKFFRLQDGNQRTYVLTHELIHSLVGVGKEGEEKSMYLFIEGITDFLADLVLKDSGLNYNLTYQNESYCISWLLSLYGTEKITKEICAGHILDFIDEQTEAGTGLKLHRALATIDNSENLDEVKNAIIAEMQILEEMSGPNTEISQKFITLFETAYAPFLT